MCLIDSVTNAFNLNYLNRSNISLSKALLYFYLVLSIPYLSELFSGQLQDFIKESRAAKHTVAVLLLLEIVVQIGGVKDVTRALVYTVVGYSWFLFTTKLDLQWNLIIVGLLIVGFIYSTLMEDKEVQSQEDPALQDEDQRKIKSKHYKMNCIIALSIMAITLMGAYEYFNKKQAQYGTNMTQGQAGGGVNSQFSYSKFLFAGRNRH